MQLVCLDDPKTLIPIGFEILLIGRDPDCDVIFRSNRISRQHCCLARVHDHLLVRDLGSTNGIRINGNKCKEGELHKGDVLTIANIPFRLEDRPAKSVKTNPRTRNLETPQPRDDSTSRMKQDESRPTTPLVINDSIRGESDETQQLTSAQEEPD
ncbi:MAG: FHA domain-containing protein [Planctomycetota bacterium]